MIKPDLTSEVEWHIDIVGIVFLIGNNISMERNGQ